MRLPGSGADKSIDTAGVQVESEAAVVASAVEEDLGEKERAMKRRRLAAANEPAARSGGQQSEPEADEHVGAEGHRDEDATPGQVWSGPFTEGALCSVLDKQTQRWVRDGRITKVYKDGCVKVAYQFDAGADDFVEKKMWPDVARG